MAEIATYSICDLPTRGMGGDSLEYYGVRVAVSEADGSTPMHTYFPYTAAHEVVGYKEKDLDRVRSEPGAEWAGMMLTCSAGDRHCALTSIRSI